MILVAFIFLYLAIKKGYEPLLLLPIAFGMLLANIYPLIIQDGGLLNYFFKLDEWSILPSLIFLGVGAMTDFGPLIANPKSFLLGAAAQLGIYVAYFLAIFLGFNGKAAAAISIIGGADGPTAIFVTSRLAPELLGSIAKYHNDVDGIILLTAFPCGPDSMINEMIIRRIKDRPILNLLLDSQDGNAGIETRLESFIDIIRFRKEARL